MLEEKEYNGRMEALRYMKDFWNSQGEHSAAFRVAGVMDDLRIDQERQQEQELCEVCLTWHGTHTVFGMLVCDKARCQDLAAGVKSETFTKELGTMTQGATLEAEFGLGDKITDGKSTGVVHLVVGSVSSAGASFLYMVAADGENITAIIKGEDAKIARPSLEEAWARVHRLIAFRVFRDADWMDYSLTDDEETQLRADCYKIIGFADNGFGRWTAITVDIKEAVRASITNAIAEYKRFDADEE